MESCDRDLNGLLLSEVDIGIPKLSGVHFIWLIARISNPSSVALM